MIPERISALDNKLVHLTHLSAPIELTFPDWLRSKGAIVHVTHEFDHPTRPLLCGTVYERRDVQMPWYTVDPRLRRELIAAGARLEISRAADVMFKYQGGQKGRQKGGIYVYEEFGPLIISTSTSDARSNLYAVLFAYKDELKNTLGEKPAYGNIRYDETMFEGATNKAMGGWNTERSRIPMGIISLPGDDDTWTPVAWYLPDSQTIVGMDGRLLPYKAEDGKTRESMSWKNFEFSVLLSLAVDNSV